MIDIMPTLKELIKPLIPRELWDKIPRSFDIVGSRSGAVAIIEIPPELEDYKLIIGEAIIKLNKHVKTVLRKVGAREGEFRLYRFEVLVPGPTEVIHREGNYLIKVDPTKTYFSSRDQGDREDIARQVMPGEVILYPFAGVGPYAVAILRKQPFTRLVIAIELNEYAYYYMLDNIKLNKLEGKVLPLLGDAARLMQLFCGVDRVILTLPLGAHKFLGQSLMCVKNGGIVHFYHLGTEENPYGDAEAIAMSYCRELGYDCLILGRRIVRDYAPYVYKVRLDIRVGKF
ncbi:class I SAM-dependent methyltransferase [Vulcanisaeta souniana]|uniref:tRNA (guanine(37)-N(1))-methyltransferase n=1 Tax=Vulcanisaeta souniana JCM 11219 TaxID=1293586 RepID=A0A830E3M8_9CREN|nr:class I SAM-dependent methyltransferase family protein [Vulcanisaeta souniana]BDR90953.1 methyltransferase [Vulcanisaeta souniana JCM 11219]GGI79585.1 methyltransferase [Vulcanisaeta souniana JCM 11219]